MWGSITVRIGNNVDKQAMSQTLNFKSLRGLWSVYPAKDMVMRVHSPSAAPLPGRRSFLQNLTFGIRRCSSVVSSGLIKSSTPGCGHNSPNGSYPNLFPAGSGIADPLGQRQNTPRLNKPSDRP
jgi:hypothetical protein